MGSSATMVTSLAGVAMPNPVLTASGCAAAGRELAPYLDPAGLGAVVTKSVMLRPRSGRAAPRMAETPSGMLNSIGLQGPGIEAFLAEDLPWLFERGARAVVSIAGGSVAEFAELAGRLAGAPGLALIEANISCPNVASRGQVFACHPDAAADVVAAVKAAASVPVLAKLSPDVTDIVAIARSCVDAGADGLSMINTLLGLAIDVDTLRPVLAGVTGGLSGPAIRPVALRCVWQVHAALPDVPILGMGGIMTGRDALQFPPRRCQCGLGRYGGLPRPHHPGPGRAAAARRAGPAGVRPDHRRGRMGPPGARPVTEPTFGARLQAVTAERGPLCVGIDPHPQLLTAWGLPDDAAGLARFVETVLAALGDRVAVLKPQSAFFERHGSRGVAVLEQTLDAIRRAGAISVLDVKRGDIGSTAAAYAAAYLDPGSPLAADAITASPYLGFGSLRPMLDAAAANARGVFVLALTSNPEGPQVQHARTAGGSTVAQQMLDAVADRNGGATPIGSVGVVVGATVGRCDHRFGHLNGPILAPGLGTQGGTPATLRALFGTALPGVLPSASRAVLGRGPDVDDLRAAAAELAVGIGSVLSAQRSDGAGERVVQLGPGQRLPGGPPAR